MPLEQAIVRYTKEPGRVWLREPTGRDEVAVDDVSTFTAIRLLDQLLVALPAAVVHPGMAQDLTASDRDQLLAAVYRQVYGDRVVSTVRCSACTSPFDLSFSLAQLMDTVDHQRAPSERLIDGSFRLADGTIVRLPTGRDECEVAALPAPEAERTLYERCRLSQHSASQPDELGDVLDKIAPVLDLELDAHCPECDQHEAVHFDIQSFVLKAFIQERRQLTAEVHCLARAYGWSLRDILSLTRSDRRAYVALIEAEQLRNRRGSV
jgi:hypothetical protein